MILCECPNPARPKLDLDVVLSNYSSVARCYGLCFVQFPGLCRLRDLIRQPGSSSPLDFLEVDRWPSKSGAVNLGGSTIVLEKSAKSLGTFDRTRTQRGLAFDQ